jgi:hypothetical protein
MSDITNLGSLYETPDMGPHDPGNIGTKKFYGKYRGTVLDNVDLEMRGRLLVQVQDVYDLFPSTWALPCMPLAGPQMGMYLVPPLPSIGASVWIEFEQGNPDYPIWVGFFWGSKAAVPLQVTKLAPPGLPAIVMTTPTQNAIVLTDVGIFLTNATGTSSIILSDEGVQIIGPVVNIIATGSFDVNGGALHVLP